jgi:succinate dehydrogenase/fumarate reductase flavoprotein subunit
MSFYAYEHFPTCHYCGGGCSGLGKDEEGHSVCFLCYGADEVAHMSVDRAEGKSPAKCMFKGWHTQETA